LIFRLSIATLKEDLETTFGTEFSLDIRVLKELWVDTQFVDEDLQAGLDYENKQQTTLRTNELKEVTSDIWKGAYYVRVSAAPVNPTVAPPYALETVEFKGTFPKRATFYVQPDGAEVQQHLQQRYQDLVVGDGEEAHGRRSRAVPL